MQQCSHVYLIHLGIYIIRMKHLSEQEFNNIDEVPAKFL